MAQWSVPGYTALKTLGSGGFGEVMLARHDATGTPVAIKYLHGNLLADKGFTEMFRAEAAVLASLEDPNIVRLYEYIETPVGAAIVMELVDGVSLRDILDRQGATTAEAALVVLLGSLLGLAAAHRRGVVHRDYKPANVLVNGEGASKLTDFGIAARTGDNPIPAGTLVYAAPEQIAGAPASPASDVYAATATFYECLTGRPPFTGEAVQLLYKHSFEPVPLEPLPEPLRPLVAAGMAKDPQGRPADAVSFVAELQKLAAGAYGQDWARRGRSHLGEAALLLAALWPSAGASAGAQGATVHRLSLLRHMRHLTPVKVAIAVGVAVGVVAGGVAVAAGLSHHPSATVSHHPRAAHRPSLSKAPRPTLGRLAGLFAHGRGFGQVEPSQVNNGGDPTGVVTQITWKSWGGPRAIGRGVSDYVAPGQSVAGGTQEPVTIVAFNLGSCGINHMYQAVEWYFPQHRQAFNPNQYENICTGAFVLPHPTASASPQPSTVAQPWTASALIITSHSLGAVTIGMTIQQASAAAGERLVPVGDGAYYPTTGATRGLSAEGSGAGTVSCVSAHGLAGSTPTVTTPQGFRLGGTLTQLKAVYGSSLQFVPAPATGYSPVPGYVVTFPDGNLAFRVSNGKVTQILGGPGTVPSSVCA